MPSVQQNIGQTRASGFPAVFDGVINFNRKAREVADELVKIWEKNIGASMDAAGKLLGAKTLQDVTAIQLDLMKAAYETINTHSRKIFELNASTRDALAKGYGNAFSALADSRTELTRKATEMTRSMGDRTLNVAQHIDERSPNTARRGVKTTGNGAHA